ncbi:MAG: hypothetical protein WAO52_03615 [Prolixibacteraceae bacterium]
MKAVKNLVLSVTFLIIIAGTLFASNLDNGSTRYLNLIESPETISKSEIRPPVELCYLAIETNTVTQNISEVHRLSSVFELLSCTVPLNYNFRRLSNFTTSKNIVSSIPIFIRGHALRN